MWVLLLLLFSLWSLVSCSLSYFSSSSSSSLVSFSPSLLFFYLSGSGPNIRPRGPVRALPTPEQQLAMQGEAGEFVSVCLSVCPYVRVSVWCVWLAMGDVWTLGGFLIKKTDDSLRAAATAVLSQPLWAVGGGALLIVSKPRPLPALGLRLPDRGKGLRWSATSVSPLPPRSWAASGDEHQRPRLRAHLLHRVVRRRSRRTVVPGPIHQSEWR